MDIAAMSMDLSAMRLQQSVGLSIMKKTMEQQEVQTDQLIAMMDQAQVQPPSEHLIDLHV